MIAIEIHEARSRLSALVKAIEAGQASEVILLRDGKPVARIVPLAKPGTVG